MDEERLVKKKTKAKRDGNVSQLAQVSKELGDFYFESGRLKDALLEYHDQLMACEVLNKKIDCAIAHRMIGEVHANLGDYEEALTHQTLHLEGAKETNNVLEQQRALATIGRTQFCLGEALPEQSSEREDAFTAAKKAYSKSLKLCDQLENMDITLAEKMEMRARLLLNLGLLLEEQKEPEQAIDLIEKAAELCKKHKLLEDLDRAHIALGAVHERQGNINLALKQIDEAINIEGSSMKANAKLTKAELLLRLGRWSEAREILVTLYTSKNLPQTTSQEVERLLRIVVTICRAEDSLEVESDREIRQGLYEKLGDASVAVRSYDKALKYYHEMLSCADMECSSEQISAALVSLAQTYRDTGRYEEALPYVRRELRLCKEPKEICRSALELADFLYLTKASDSEIMETYEIAMKNARKCESRSLEASALKEMIIYLEDTGQFEKAEKYKKKLDIIGEIETQSETESESANIGADICLEDLSDVEMRKEESTARNPRRTKRSLVVKRNDKGETKLHVACINGNIEEVAKLLDAHHPTNVNDHCGWTPLHEAANHGHIEIAELLIKAGANVNDPGGPMCGGVTPLHDAASCGNLSIMRLLMKKGADLFLKTREGDTVLDCLEGWRDRVEDLPSVDQAEYDDIHDTLSSILPKSIKYKKKSSVVSRTRALDDPMDDEDGGNEADAVDSNHVERISAGEDYRRTIENLKNRGRLVSSEAKRVSSAPKKVIAPLIDSEQALVDDWLENDLETTVREKTLTEERLSVSKRKSSNTTPDNDKMSKRPRNQSNERSKSTEIVDLDENSQESTSDMSDIMAEPRITTKIAKKRPRQVSLLKAGFTRDSVSRTPSPIFNYTAEASTNNTERITETSSEPVKLQIRIEDKIINLKLRFPEQRETTVTSLTNDIIEKFIDETGVRIQITLTTMSGEVLLRENTLKNVRPVDGIVRLIADIVEIDVPAIGDRYARICKNQIQPREPMNRLLKICDNTSTFRAKSGEIMDEEIIPLLKCLEYQEKLQILQIAGASLYNAGEILNITLKRLNTLQELHLQCCDIDEHCLSKIERLPTQLRILDLSYNPLGPRCQDKLYKLIAHHRQLQTLNLRFCKLTNLPMSDSWGSLSNVDLSSNPLDSEVVNYFLRRQMLSLDLSYTRETEMSSIARETLDQSRISLTTLESLELSCCDLIDSDVIEIASRAVNLQKFVASGNAKLTKSSVEVLLKRVPSLSHIDATGCRKIMENPATDVYIDNPRICSLIVSMSSDVDYIWLRLWRGTANSRVLPYDIVTIKPIVY